MLERFFCPVQGREIGEQIIFIQLGEDENAIWSLLLASGYLKAEA